MTSDVGAHHRVGFLVSRGRLNNSTYRSYFTPVTYLFSAFYRGEITTVVGGGGILQFWRCLKGWEVKCMESSWWVIVTIRPVKGGDTA